MNMNTRVYLLFVFILGLLTGCDERELTEVSDDIAYLSFTTDISRDSTILSFVAYPTGVIEQDIVIEIRGCLLTEPRTFSLSVDEEKSTFPAQYCVFPEKCEFAAGQTRDTIKIQIQKFNEIGDQTLQLYLKINESEKIKEGDKAYRRVLFVLSNKISIPSWWSELNVGYKGDYIYNLAEYSYLGPYSDEKYIMFLEELAKDNVVFDGKDVLVLRKYSLRLKYRIEEFNNDPENIAAGLVPMWDETNNCPMAVKVRG